MSQHPDDQSFNRRRFLAAIGATSIASGVIGAGIAKRNLPTGNTEVVVAPPADFEPAQFDIATKEPVVKNPAELNLAKEQLASAQTRNDELLNLVNQLQEQLTASQSDLTSREARIVVLESVLEDSNKINAAALGLVALYEQLEDINIRESVQNGLGTMAAAWDEFVDDLPTASDGLVQASAKISEFDAQIPLFQTARTWLAIRLELLRRDNDGLYAVLEGISDRVGSLLDLLGGWFDQVRGWVPSRFLENANRVIDSVTTLISGVPVTVDGAQSNVANALDGWFADDDEDNASAERQPIIRRRLFQPLVQETLPQALTVIQKTRMAKQKYEADLVTQVKDTLTKRETIETQIVEFRERNGLQRTQI
ncbi:MAG: hypothetical protein AAGD96_11915 [Chloroflexota bacterium]